MIVVFRGDDYLLFFIKVLIYYFIKGLKGSRDIKNNFDYYILNR